MIKKVCHITLFALSLFFVEAHQFVPHQHDREVSGLSNFPDWLNFLSDIVNSDLGNGHLEDFKIQKESFQKFDYDTLSSSLFIADNPYVVIWLIEDFGLSYSILDIPISSRATKEYHPFRGPPSSSQISMANLV